MIAQQTSQNEADRGMGSGCLLVGLLVGAFLLGSCSQRTELGGGPGAGIETRTAIASKGTLVKEIEFSGVLAPSQLTTLTTTQIAGLTATE